jgi:hypothetical protein
VSENPHTISETKGPEPPISAVSAAAINAVIAPPIVEQPKPKPAIPVTGARINRTARHRDSVIRIGCAADLYNGVLRLTDPTLGGSGRAGDRR